MLVTLDSVASDDPGDYVSRPSTAAGAHLLDAELAELGLCSRDPRLKWMSYQSGSTQTPTPIAVIVLVFEQLIWSVTIIG